MSASKIKIEDIFPEYPESPGPLKKQYEFIFSLYSFQLKCPHCAGSHSYAEVRLNGEKCLETGKQLVRKMTLFGEQFFEGKEA